MKQALYGCACALLLALTWLALDARTVLHRMDERSERLTSSVAKAAKDAADMFTSDDVQGLIANLTTVARHAESSLTLADGVSRAAKTSADKSVDTQQAALDLISHTDASINNADGVLAQFSVLLQTVNFQTAALAHDGQATILQSTEAMKAITALASDPNLAKSLASIEKGTGAFAAAGTSVQQILYDIQHPERPGPFVRGVSIMLQILGVTSKMSQSAPIFGR